MSLLIKALKYLTLFHISFTFICINEILSASPVTPPANMSRRLIAVQGMVYCKSCKYSGIDTLLEASPLQDGRIYINGKNNLLLHVTFAESLRPLGFLMHRATVKVACNNTKRGLTMETKTDKNGYFMLAPKKLTSYAFHTCRAWPTNSGPATETVTCTVPSQLNNGTTGSMLKPSKSMNIGEQDYVLFSVGPFAFEPTCTR